MAGIVQIKRSTGNSAPSSLLQGELAWAQGTGGTAQGGALFIGGTDDAVKTIITKAQTDKLDAIEAGAQVNVVDSVAGRTGDVTLTHADLSDFDAEVNALIGAADLADLNDVGGTAPSDGQVLTWNNSAGRWEAQAAGSGVTQFVSLNDTPANFTGSGGFFVRVNGAANALEFVENIDAGTF